MTVVVSAAQAAAVGYVAGLAGLIESVEDCATVLAEVAHLVAVELSQQSVKGDRTVLRHLDAAVLHLSRAGLGVTPVSVGRRMAVESLTAAVEALGAP